MNVNLDFKLTKYFAKKVSNWVYNGNELDCPFGVSQIVDKADTMGPCTKVCAKIWPNLREHTYKLSKYNRAASIRDPEGTLAVVACPCNVYGCSKVHAVAMELLAKI